MSEVRTLKWLGIKSSVPEIPVEVMQKRKFAMQMQKWEKDLINAMSS
jgi:hypothetical protein